MSIVIRIDSTATNPTRYTNKRTNQPDQEQRGWAFLTDRDGRPNKYPTEIRFVVEGKPYEPGDYTLSPSAFYVGDFGRLTCSVRLAPIQQNAKA